MATHAKENEEPKDKLYEVNKDIEDKEEYIQMKEYLLYTSKKEEDKQRHSIFKIRCTVNERVYDLVVDRESNKNTVFETMVDKLQLKTH